MCAHSYLERLIIVVDFAMMDGRASATKLYEKLLTTAVFMTFPDQVVMSPDRSVVFSMVS